jgi:peptide/nickel transport system substrate-binding protein
MQRFGWRGVSPVLATAGLLAFVVAAGATRASAPTAATAQAQGGRLVMLAAGDVDTIDPGVTYYTFGQMVATAAHRPLLGSSPTGQVTPDLAQAPPEVAPDGLTVTVRLRRGVRFSPPVNREVTSRDVKYAIERGFFRTVATPYAPLYFADLVGARAGVAPGTTIAGLETPDDQTLVFRLARPHGALVAAALVMPLTAPVPPEYAARFDARSPSAYGRHQVATGPYMIRADAQGNTVGYRPGRLIHLVRNPNWDATTDFRPARLDEIEIREGNTNTDRAARRILRGRGLASADFPPSAEVLRTQLRRHRAQFAFSGEGGVNFSPLNNKLRPFTNLNVRRAVVAGFNRAAFLQALGGAVAGRLASHFIPPGVPGFDEAGGFRGTGSKLYANPHGSRRLAASYFRRAGFRSGRFTGRSPLRVVTSNDTVGRRVGRIASRNLERLGFRVRLRAVTFDRMLSLCARPTSRIHMCPFFGWFRDFPDAQTVIDPLFNGRNIAAQNNNNWSQLDVPAINQAIDAAKDVTDPQARAQAWAAIDRRLVDLAPGVVLSYPRVAVLRSSDVTGQPNPLFGGVWDLAFMARR